MFKKLRQRYLGRSGKRFSECRKVDVILADVPSCEVSPPPQATRTAYVIADNLLYRTWLSRHTLANAFTRYLSNTHFCMTCKILGLVDSKEQIVRCRISLWKQLFKVPYRRHVGARFKFTTLIAIFMIFNTSFSQMPRQYPKQGDDCFLSIPFEYITRQLCYHNRRHYFRSMRARARTHHTHTHNAEVDSYVRMIRNREVWGLNLDMLPYVSVVHAVWFAFFELRILVLDGHSRRFFTVLVSACKQITQWYIKSTDTDIP